MPLPPIKLTIPKDKPQGINIVLDALGAPRMPPVPFWARPQSFQLDQLKPEQRALLEAFRARAWEAEMLLGEAAQLADAAIREHHHHPTPETHAKAVEVLDLVESASETARQLGEEATTAIITACRERAKEIEASRLKSALEIAGEKYAT